MTIIQGSNQNTAMTAIQRFFMAALPARYAESMRADSMAWRIRCCTCDFSRSIWDAGGIRWKARSTGKRTIIKCPHCGQRRVATIEKVDSVA